MCAYCYECTASLKYACKLAKVCYKLDFVSMKAIWLERDSES